MTDDSGQETPAPAAQALEQALRTLEETVCSLRRQLAQLTEAIRDEWVRPVTLAELARQEIQSRALRLRFFDPRLFRESAWNMLLDLFSQETNRRPVSISSLCIASGVPPTTALRWIGALENAGLVERSKDPRDKRRVFVQLTAAGRTGVAGYLASLSRQRAPLLSLRTRTA